VDGSEMLEATEAVPLAIDSLAVVEQFSAPEKVENLDLIHIPDPVEDVDTTQPIPESETALVGDTQQTTIPVMTNHSLISTTEPNADSYRPFMKIPQPKNSDSLVKKTHPDLKIILDAIDFVVLKHRWGWKQVADVEDAAVEAETPKCRCPRSRAEQRTGCSRG
jgi:hypothetical protein